MLVLSYHNGLYLQNRIIVILGNGFIGSSLSQKLMKYEPSEIKNYKIDWSNDEKFSEQIKQSIHFIQKTNSVQQIDWIWSAGKTGFGSTTEETDKEFKLFRSFLEMIKNENLISLSSIPFVFHLMSSAGGLFEGVVNISTNTLPEPKRPYGQLKLAQENLAKEYFQNNTHIYRLSSVFGNSINNQRVGIITALIRNTLTCRMTNIYGSFDTKRDYVWVDDLSNFIVEKIVWNTKSEESLFFLASGKASSIYEIIELVKKITNVKVMHTLEFSSQNNQQIVFSPSVLPKNWSSTSIETAIRIVYQQILVSNSSNFN